MKHNFYKTSLLILSLFLIVFNGVSFELYSFLDPLCIENVISEDGSFATMDINIISCKANGSPAKKELSKTIEKFKTNPVLFRKTSQDITQVSNDTSETTILSVSSFFNVPLRI
jgi:hypothetical protein